MAVLAELAAAVPRSMSVIPAATTAVVNAPAAMNAVANPARDPATAKRDPARVSANAAPSPARGSAPAAGAVTARR